MPYGFHGNWAPDDCCAVTPGDTLGPWHPGSAPQEAAALIQTRDTIGFGLGPANPDAFFTALGQRDDWEDLDFGGALLLGYYTVLPHPASPTGAASSDRPSG